MGKEEHIVSMDVEVFNWGDDYQAFLLDELEVL
jgi:hypothetical protein